jgi:DNA-binding NarL/FixJ family response regulator
VGEAEFSGARLKMGSGAPPPRAAALRVLIADDHPLLRTALRRLLIESGMDVVAEAGDRPEAVRLAVREHPDIALLDMVMPGGGGLAAAREITRACRETRVVIMSGYPAGDHVTEAGRAGAVAFIPKTAALVEVVAVLHAVRDGLPYSAGVDGAATIRRSVGPASHAGRALAADRLTPREREVLGMVADGLSSVAIGARLGASDRTIEHHRQSIMDKLGVHSAVGLMRFALERRRELQ